MKQIRVATIEDAVVIATLNADVQSIHAAGLPYIFKASHLNDQLVTEFKEKLAQQSNLFLIAEIESAAVGYLFAEYQHKAGSVRHYPSDTLYIHHISIGREYQRKGMGKALMDEARSRASSRGIKQIALDVWRFNEEARKFFAGYGLTVYNERMWLNDT